MRRILLSVMLALLLALTLVGVKRVLSPSTTSGTTLVATGGPEPAPIPW